MYKGTKFMNNDIIRGSIISVIIVGFLFGFAIYLNLSTPKEVSIPNVVGLTVEEAENKIKNAGLNFEIDKETTDENKQNNIVLSQDPTYIEVYNKIKKGSTIKVIINKK